MGDHTANEADIRSWVAGRRAASAREAAERLAHPLSPEESFKRACGVGTLVSATRGSHARAHASADVAKEDLAVYSTWVRLRSAFTA